MPQDAVKVLSASTDASVIFVEKDIDHLRVNRFGTPDKGAFT